MRGKRRRMSDIWTHSLLLGLSVMFLYPFTLVFLNSFKDKTEILLNPFGVPWHWILGNFPDAWRIAHLGRLFINSIFYTGSSVVLAILFTSLASYGLARRTTRPHQFFYLFFVGGIFVPFQLLIIPLFKIIKDIHLYNTFAAVIIVYIAYSIPFGIYLMTTFMLGLPREVAEAGIIDGCSYFGLFSKIYFPLIRSVVVTFAILQGLFIWNDFLIPYLLVTEDVKRSLPTGMLVFKSKFYTNWGDLMASILMMIIPIVAAYIFLQKYIIKGVTGGAVKG